MKYFSNQNLAGLRLCVLLAIAIVSWGCQSAPTVREAKAKLKANPKILLQINSNISMPIIKNPYGYTLNPEGTADALYDELAAKLTAVGFEIIPTEASLKAAGVSAPQERRDEIMPVGYQYKEGTRASGTIVANRGKELLPGKSVPGESTTVGLVMINIIFADDGVRLWLMWLQNGVVAREDDIHSNPNCLKNNRPDDSEKSLIGAYRKCALEAGNNFVNELR